MLWKHLSTSDRPALSNIHVCFLGLMIQEK